MAQRKRIGLLFESYSTLPAYVIYIINMVRTLNLVDEERKPHLVILHRKDSPIEELKKLKYPYLEFYELQNIYSNPFKRIINKISRTILQRNLFSFIDSTFPTHLDTLFPYGERPEATYIKHKIIWKPDFQEYHLPIYFTKHELYENHAYTEQQWLKPIHLVLSSQDALRDFKRYFPENHARVNLLKFTSFLPDISKESIETLRKKFNIIKPYFIVSNQFWPHKNHLTVLKSLYKNKTSQSSLYYQVVFTGKKNSSRDPEIINKLEFFIERHGIYEDVIFTGFISRESQLCLMQNAIAIIQPSLFEGWSTVVEDSKALGQHILASSLSVHKEQLQKNVAFFNPFDFGKLSELMEKYSRPNEIPLKEKIDYSENILQYKKELENTFEI